MNDQTTSTVTTTSRRSLLVGGAGVVAAASLSAATLATAAEHAHSSVSPRPTLNGSPVSNESLGALNSLKTHAL
jgi:hypothetical protein